MHVLTCSFLIPINTQEHFATTAGNIYQGISLGQKTMGISQGYGRYVNSQGRLSPGAPRKVLKSCLWCCFSESPNKNVSGSH